MTDVEYLTLEDLISLVRRLDVGPIRDLGLLDAAVARPRSSTFGAEAYPSIERKAAALLHSLVRNHALADGNKRLGWLATVVFLDINRRRCRAISSRGEASLGDADDQLQGIVVLDVARCRMSGSSEVAIAAWRDRATGS